MLREQTYSERRWCGRRPSEVTAVRHSNATLYPLEFFSNLNPKRKRGFLLAYAF